MTETFLKRKIRSISQEHAHAGIMYFLFLSVQPLNVSKIILNKLQQLLRIVWRVDHCFKI